MKKVISFLFAMALSCGVYAQGNVTAVMDKLEKSKLELQHKTKGTKSSTWLKNAGIYIDLAEVNTMSFFAGMPAQQAIMMLGKPVNAAAPEVVEINGVAYTKYQYPSVDAYFDSNNVLKFFIETKTEMPDALQKAEEATRHAYKMDPGSKAKVIETLDRIFNLYVAIADNNYNAGNYVVAAKNFYEAGKIGTDALLNKENANELLYFAAVSYVAGKEIKSAKPAIDLLVKNDYMKDGDVCYYQGLIENELGNKAEAEAAYIRGVKTYPQNAKILNSLIAFYLTNNEDPNKVIPFIKKAQEADPNNAVLRLAEGMAYDAMKDYEKACAAYGEAIRIAPDNFDAYYNQGLDYYRMSEQRSKELQDIDYTQQDAYNAKIAEIDAAQMKSLEVLLKAHAINAEEPNTVELIRSIYFRQRNKSAEFMEQYNIFDAKVKALKK